MNVEIINVRDNGNYLTVTVKYDFGAEDAIDIPIDTSTSGLNRILLKAYKEYLKRHNKKKELLSALRGTIELVEEPIVEEIKGAVEEAIKTAEETAKAIGLPSISEVQGKVEEFVSETKSKLENKKIEELVSDIKGKLESILELDNETIQKLINAVKEKPDLKGAIDNIISIIKKKFSKEEITEDTKEGIPYNGSSSFPWDTNK